MSPENNRRTSGQAGVEIDIDAIVLAVSELPDRTSPDDWPDAMLVTAEELREIITTEARHAEIAALSAPPSPSLREALEPFVNAGMKADPGWSAMLLASDQGKGS